MSHVNPTISSTLIVSSAVADVLAVDDVINGIGIPTNSVVLSIIYITNEQAKVEIDQTPIETDVYAIGNHSPHTESSGQNIGRVGWGTNITIKKPEEQISPTLSFSENVGGWVSFKSFEQMQMGISLANKYYTFRNGMLFLHYSETEDRNTFYRGTGVVNDGFTSSLLDVILNSDPGSVKVFNTLNYEGSQAKVDKFTYEAEKEIPLQPDTDYSDQEYYNLYKKKGWSVESIVTNKEEGKVNEFIEKEGKWFNGISKVVDTTTNVDSSDFTFQGIGVFNPSTLTNGEVDPLIDEDTILVIPGCMDPNADNYDANATIDDGSCTYPVILGCQDPTALNYNEDATSDYYFGYSCNYDLTTISGCTNPAASNYNPNATVDNGSCLIAIDPIEPIKATKNIITSTEVVSTTKKTKSSLKSKVTIKSPSKY